MTVLLVVRSKQQHMMLFSPSPSAGTQPLPHKPLLAVHPTPNVARPPPTLLKPLAAVHL